MGHRALRSIVLSEWSDESYGAVVPNFDLTAKQQPGTQTLGQFYANYFTIQVGATGNEAC